MRYLGVLFLLFVGPSFSAEGYFKDYFHDQGYNLSGQKHNDHVRTLLQYTIEPNITSAAATTRNRINGTTVDSNGVLLYPDNSPRFRVYYHSGGRFSHLFDSGGDTAYSRLRTFVRNGGSWVGSCAGAGAASLAAYPGGSEMVGVYPHFYQDRGDRFLSELQIMDMSHPIAQYYSGYLGRRDSIVDSTWFLSGGYFPDNEDPPYTHTRFLAKCITPGYSISNKWGVIEYKDTNQIYSGRVVITGAHPEAGRSGTKRGMFFAAMCRYAAEGNGVPRIKGVLLNNQPRVMNDNRRPGFEKIGDRQYHHFTVYVPADADTLRVGVDGDSGYDFNLHIRKEGPAFTGVSLLSDTTAGSDKILVLTRSRGLSQGLWHVAVECATEVTVVETRQKPDSLGIDSVQYDTYTGKTGVLNGVAYSITVHMDYDDTTPPTAPSGLAGTPDSAFPRIRLIWQDAADGETGVAWYRVYRNGVFMGENSSASFSDTVGLKIATDYTYSVSAVNGAGIEGPRNQPVLTIRTSNAVVIDNGDSGTAQVGSWSKSTSGGSYDNGGSLYSRTLLSTYSWEAEIIPGEPHLVQIWYTTATSRFSAVPVSVYDGDNRIFSGTLNQKQNGGRWNDLSVMTFTGSKARIVIESVSADSTTAADAVRFVYHGTSSGTRGTIKPMPYDGEVMLSPNPFNPVTLIQAGVSGSGRTQLAVFDLQGRQVADLTGRLEPEPGKLGCCRVLWDAGTLPAGVYLIRLQAGKTVRTRKATLLR